MVRYARYAAAKGIPHHVLPDPQKTIVRWREELAEISPQLHDDPSRQEYALRALEGLASGGNIFAMHRLGKLLTAPDSPHVDPVRAYAWLTVAEALGLGAAAPLRHAIVNDFPDAPLTEGQALAQRFLRTVTNNMKRAGS